MPHVVTFTKPLEVILKLQMKWDDDAQKLIVTNDFYQTTICDDAGEHTQRNHGSVSEDPMTASLIPFVEDALKDLWRITQDDLDGTT